MQMKFTKPRKLAQIKLIIICDEYDFNLRRKIVHVKLRVHEQTLREQ